MTFSDVVNQGTIYDTYAAHERQKEIQEEQERIKIREQYGLKDADPKLSRGGYEDPSAEISEKFIKAAKMLERMINQNIYGQVIHGNFRLKQTAYPNMTPFHNVV